MEAQRISSGSTGRTPWRARRRSWSSMSPSSSCPSAFTPPCSTSSSWPSMLSCPLPSPSSILAACKISALLTLFGRCGSSAGIRHRLLLLHLPLRASPAPRHRLASRHHLLPRRGSASRRAGGRSSRGSVTPKAGAGPQRGRARPSPAVGPSAAAPGWPQEEVPDPTMRARLREGLPPRIAPLLRPPPSPPSHAPPCLLRAIAREMRRGERAPPFASSSGSVAK